MAKDGMGRGQPRLRVLVRFLLESSTDPVQSYWYCFGQGDFLKAVWAHGLKEPLS